MSSMPYTPDPPIADAPPAGTPLAEVAKILLGIDANNEPERAQRVHASHLGRARWMTEHGYRDLLQGS